MNARIKCIEFHDFDFSKYLRKVHGNKRSLTYLKSTSEPYVPTDSSNNEVLVTSEHVINRLCELWEVSSLPAVVMGPPGVGKSLGQLFWQFVRIPVLETFN